MEFPPDLPSAYAPLFLLDSRERRAPCDALEYARACDVRVLDTGAFVGGDFAQHAGDPSLVLDHVRPVPTAPAAQPAPLYAHVTADASSYHILYMVFWTFNDAYHGVAGAHQADLERVRVVVSKATGEVQRVYYAAHGLGDGLWVQAADVRFADAAKRRPLVHVARGSHACYPSHGTYWRACGLANDACDGRKAWVPRGVEPWPAELTRFIGRFSRQVMNPTQQSWWTVETGTSTTAWRRMFPCAAKKT